MMWDPQLVPRSKLGNRYRVGRRMAAGLASALYEADDLRSSCSCTLDVRRPEILKDGDARARFERDASAAGYIASAFVARALGAGIDERTGLPFVVLEPLSGETLAQRLARSGPLARTDVLACCWQLARALDKAHHASLVHGDLSPDNVFFEERDDGRIHVKLLGFGLAKLGSGSPLYSAPEQLTPGATFSAQTDVCGFAILTYTALLGKPYFSEEASAAAESSALEAAAQRGPLEPPSARAARAGITLPTSFDDWFARATAVDPANRFASVVKAVVSLDHAIPAERAEPTASRAPASRRSRRPKPRRGSQTPPRSSLVRGLLVALAALAILAGIVWALRAPPSAPDRKPVAQRAPYLAIMPLAPDPTVQAAPSETGAEASNAAPAPPAPKKEQTKAPHPPRAAPAPTAPAPKPRARPKADPHLLEGI